LQLKQTRRAYYANETRKKNGGNDQQGFIHYKYVYTYHTDGGVRRGRVHIVVGFITTYAIGVYHH